MYKWAISFAILFATLLGVLFGGSSVNAVSDYDDFEKADSLIITSSDGTQEEDITETYAQILLDKNPTAYTSFNNAVMSETGAWLISQSSDSNGRLVVYLSWTEDATGATTNYSNNTEYKEFQITSWGTATPASAFIRINNSGVVDVQYYATTSLNNAIWYQNKTYASYWFKPFIFYGIDFTYPTGYEGEIIPDSYTPPTPPLDWTPKINMVQVIDWKITLQDQNFNTFDNVPFTCNDGLTPIIQYDLLNNDTSENLSQGVFSPTVPIVFESEKYGIETEYKFIGNYYCGTEDGQPTFSGQTTYYFTVNASGVYITPTDSCYTDTFPFIDMNGCTGVIENLLNNLSFGAISFPNWSINNDSCHSLGIIGDWLNVPATSRTICPQFPQSIRNIVTPFLTFVLGITILGVIVTKSRSDTH